ncbi:DNA repair protein RAD50.L-like isoform X1 [Linepithema humile]|uniref:DNA repair protein RAD50.L-like isoform X1 n=1 Tax=Linepithema humile TaxID=83485 RepID=UPI00351E406B
MEHLKDKQEDLFARKVSMEATVEKLREDLTSAKDQLDSGTQRLEKTKADWQKQETDRQSMAESTRCLSELHKIMNDVESFFNSNVTENLAKYESEIKASKDLLTDLMNERKDVEQAINNKLKEVIMCQEIRRRELLNNMMLREIKETVVALKGQCKKLFEKLKNMNYDEMAYKLDQLENKKQVLLCQINVALGDQEKLERVIKQYTQELRKKEYQLSCHNYINKCIELEV